MRKPLIVVSALGISQVLNWGSSFYLLTVLASPIGQETGWPLGWIVGGLSLGLLVAGVVSRGIGRTIERRGGRPVLVASALFMAAGLTGMALSNAIAVYLASWTVLGLGMGAGLYEAGFSTLGRLYGTAARSSITGLTIWGGFASTVCWPLSALLVESFGWRGTCLIYAGIQLALILPIHLFALPREERRRLAAPEPLGAGTSRGPPAASGGPLFYLMAACFTAGAVVLSVIAVHLLTILQAREVTLAAAVALGALIGPSQVGARVVELGIGRRLHPIWSAAASVILMAVGLIIVLDGTALVIGFVLYGAGVGIQSITRGTLPLALFGASSYPVLMGRLATPTLIAQSAAPTLGALLVEYLEATTTLAVLAGLAAANIALVAAIWWLSRSARLS